MIMISTLCTMHTISDVF